MTATVVNGLEVIADEPTQSPIATADGQPVYRLATLDQVTADRDRWKRRARSAERSLRTIRGALRPTGD